MSHAAGDYPRLFLFSCAQENPIENVNFIYLSFSIALSLSLSLFLPEYIPTSRTYGAVAWVSFVRKVFSRS